MMDSHNTNRGHKGDSGVISRFAGDVFLHMKQGNPDPPLLRRHTAEEAYKKPATAKVQSEVSV